MIRSAYLLISCMIFCHSGSAQSSPDSIHMFKKGGLAFTRHGYALRPKEVFKFTLSNPVAAASAEKARSNYILSRIITIAGGFMIGWPLGNLVDGTKPDWIIAGLGAGTIAFSIPFSKAYSFRIRKAVEKYNGH